MTKVYGAESDIFDGLEFAKDDA